jgi:hypothetical protein
MSKSEEPTTERRNRVLTPEFERKLKQAYVAWEVLDRCIKLVEQECRKNPSGLPF